MGNPLDGVSDHMKEYPEERRFVVADGPAVNVVEVLRERGVEVLVNYLPVGSEEAARYLRPVLPGSRGQPRELYPGLHCLRSEVGRHVRREGHSPGRR